MEGKKKKERKYRYAYLNDFKLNENNEYEYRGDIYVPDMGREEKDAFLKRLLFLHLLLAAIIVAGGFLPYKAMNGTFYVIVPYVFECLFVFLLFPCLYTVWKKDGLRAYEHEKSAAKIRPYYYVIAINAAIGIIGCIIHGILHGFEPAAVSGAYLIFRVLSLLLSYFLQKSCLLLRYSKKI